MILAYSNLTPCSRIRTLTVPWQVLPYQASANPSSVPSMSSDYSQLFDYAQQVEVSSSSSRDIPDALADNTFDCGVGQPDPVPPKQVSTFLGHPQRLIASSGSAVPFKFISIKRSHVQTRLSMWHFVYHLQQRKSSMSGRSGARCSEATGRKVSAPFFCLC